MSLLHLYSFVVEVANGFINLEKLWGVKKLFILYTLSFLVTGINIYGQADVGDTALVNRLNQAALSSFKKEALSGNRKPHDSALMQSAQALKLAAQLHYNKGAGDAHANLGYYYRFIRADFAEATGHFIKAAALHRLSHEVNSEGLDLSHIGFIKKAEGKSQTAISYFLKAEAVFKEMNLPSSGYPSLGIGGIYAERGNYLKAEEFMLRALKKFAENRKESSMLNAYFDLIELNLDQNYRKACQYLSDAQKIIIKNHQPPYYQDLMHIYEAKVMRARSDYHAAVKLLEMASRVWYDQVTSAIIHEELGKVMAAQGNLAKAELYFKKSFVEANRANDQNLALADARELSMVLIKQKKISEALHFSALSQTLGDSLNKRNLAALAADMEDQIKYTRREKENEMLKMSLTMTREKLLQQQIIIAGCFIICMLTGSVIFILLRSRKNMRKKNKLLQVQNFEIQAQNEEIRSQHEEISSQSEELRAEGEYLALQNEKLNELNHEKDALMSIVAHDLRSPLNQSKGLAKILQLSELSQEQRSLTDMLVKVSNEGLMLIKDVLQVNSMTHQPVETEVVNLHRLIHDSVLSSLHEQATKKQISFYVSVDEELTLWSESLSLKRILENLLSNAVKFSRQGANVFLRVMSSDDAVYISVQDQGPGISEEDQKKMFRKFQRLSARPTFGEASTGLGLAIVKGLVEKLHGEITVNSQMNVGTEFCIRLSKSIQLVTSQSITVSH